MKTTNEDCLFQSRIHGSDHLHQAIRSNSQSLGNKHWS